MNVLITGGTGFVGSHVAVKFAQEGFGVIVYDNRPRKLDYLEGWLDRVTVVRGDITDIKQLMETVESHEVDGIIHTAAMPNEEFLQDSPLKGFEVNVGGTLKVLEAARMKQLKRVVYTSTGAMFGHREDLNPIMETDSVSPANFYSTTKRISELLMDMYHLVYRLDTVIVRLSHVYGPGLLERDERTTYVSAYLWKAMRGERVDELSGRDFPANLTYVKDAANGIFLAYTTKTLKHRLFNLSSGRNYQISEVVKLIEKIVPGVDIHVGPGMGRGASLMTTSVRGPLAIDRAQREMDFRVQYSLDEGLREFATWARKQISK